MASGTSTLLSSPKAMRVGGAAATCPDWSVAGSPRSSSCVACTLFSPLYLQNEDCDGSCPNDALVQCEVAQLVLPCPCKVVDVCYSLRPNAYACSYTLALQELPWAFRELYALQKPLSEASTTTVAGKPRRLQRCSRQAHTYFKFSDCSVALGGPSRPIAHL